MISLTEFAEFFWNHSSQISLAVSIAIAFMTARETLRRGTAWIGFILLTLWVVFALVMWRIAFCPIGQ